ncbi:homing endonuclease associated repeat-containing protein [Natronomonas sp.]|uniref:homing endonuclease associated repeat-containing protein n=1 Tax=Natronomonas sp. TaxID=2184060 RepID=UPI002FC3BF53
MATPKPECIDALREAADRLDESPTKAAYEALGLTPASATIIRQLGGWNAAKEMAGLETNASTGSRVGAEPDDVDLPDSVDWSDLSVDQRWHYRNREWNAERTRRRRARLRKWLNDYKEECGCVRCGEDDRSCLDFHHRQPGEKGMDVGTMVTHGYGKDALRAEIETCDVLCANCHRREHHSPPTRELRTWVFEQKRNLGGCSRCGETDPTSLEFHHVGEKDATIARLVADDRPKEVIEAEMDECELLCANCHRRVHFEPPNPDAAPGEHDNHK